MTTPYAQDTNPFPGAETSDAITNVCSRLSNHSTATRASLAKQPGGVTGTGAYVGTTSPDTPDSWADLPTSEANYARTFISTTEPRHTGKIPGTEALHAVADWTLASASHPNLVSLYIHSDTEVSAIGEEPGGRFPAEGLKETVLVAHSSSLAESSQVVVKVD
jgi:hypothetical protein